jgi:hypothetical protein
VVCCNLEAETRSTRLRDEQGAAAAVTASVMLRVSGLGSEMPTVGGTMERSLSGHEHWRSCARGRASSLMRGES